MRKEEDDEGSSQKEDEKMIDDVNVASAGVFEDDAPAVLSKAPPGLEERLDVTRISEYPMDLIERHKWRYDWVNENILQNGTAELCLDFGCGTGFGTKILLKAAKNAAGVDIDEESIRKASRYCNSGSARFYGGSEHAIPNPVKEYGRKFDAVVCLEVIEHLQGPGAFLRLARSYSNSANAKIFVSTPVRPEGLEPDSKPGNRFHVREFSEEELRHLVRDNGWNVHISDTESLPGFILLVGGAA